MAFRAFAAGAADKPFQVGIASLINPRSAPQFLAFEERLRQLLNPAGRLLRDAKLYEIGAGTSEIRRWLIGRELFEETG